MPPKTSATAPWQDLEKQAYHAYREWPLWLALRERELAGRTDKRAPGAAPAAEESASQPPAKGDLT
jgi:hypothetical protein